MASYSINGIPLDNDDFGWSLLRRSQILLGVTKSLSNLTVPGRNGVVPGVPSFRGSPTQTIVVRTPGANIESLYALFLQNGGMGTITRDGDTAREAQFELASIDSQGINFDDNLVNVTIALRFPTADWRDVSVTTITPSTVSSASEVRDIFSGISAEINDAQVFLSGNFGNMTLTDLNSGSWLKTIITWPNVSSTGLLYNMGTGQAFRATTAAPFTPVTDMSEYVDVSGGGGFRITPLLNVSDPSDRIARLTLVTTSHTSVTFGVEGKNAYAMQNGDVG